MVNIFSRTVKVIILVLFWWEHLLLKEEIDGKIEGIFENTCSAEIFIVFYHRNLNKFDFKKAWTKLLISEL